MTREIRLNAFETKCITHQSARFWASTRDQASHHKDLDDWTDPAGFSKADISEVMAGRADRMAIFVI